MSNYKHGVKNRNSQKLTELYCCNECTYSCTCVEDLKKHLTDHSKGRSFNCTRCDFSANLENDLRLHEMNHIEVRPSQKAHPKMNLKRSVQNSITQKEIEETNKINCKSKLKKHEMDSQRVFGTIVKSQPLKISKKEVIRRQPLFCPHCKFTCSSHYDLIKHQEMHSIQIQTGSRRNNLKDVFKLFDRSDKIHFSCFVRIERLDSEIDRTQFYKIRHKDDLEADNEKRERESNAGNAGTKQCSYRTSKRQNLHTHQLRYHARKTVFSCEHCRASFECNASLNRHLRIHTGERPYSCPHCQYSFTQRSHLDRHLKIHTRQKRFACTKCNASFTQRSNLFRHLKIHSPVVCNQNKLACNNCGASFSCKSNLTRHRKYHCGQNKFTCQDCSASFAQKINFIRHLGTHSRKNKFTCQDCSASFAQKINFIRHLGIHSRKNKFRCEDCSASFAHKSNLFRHIRIHGTKKRRKCKYCRASFILKCSLVHHMRAHKFRKIIRKSEPPAEISKTEKVKWYHCMNCVYKTKNKHVFHSHVTSHSIKEGFCCPNCSFTCSEIRSFMRHIKSHSDKGNSDDLDKHFVKDTSVNLEKYIVKDTSVNLEKNSVKDTSVNLEKNYVKDTSVNLEKNSVNDSSDNLEKNSVNDNCDNLEKHVVKNSSDHGKIENVVTVRDISESEHNRLSKSARKDNTELKQETNFVETVPFELNFEDSIVPAFVSKIDFKSENFQEISEVLSDSVTESDESSLFTVQSIKQEDTPEKPVESGKGDGDIPRRRYRCCYCLYCTDNKYHLKRHIFSHRKRNEQSTGSLLCRYCSFTSSVVAEFYTHQFIHRGIERVKDVNRTAEKPFPCQYGTCKASFSKKAYLFRHLKSHTGDKPYSCSECNKCFGQKCNLNSHMRLHTGERPYVCPLCDFRFALKGNLTKHLKRH